ncbi:unnamed protein product [Peniophora sp. CBMAI 1063]|nr:unnamed protein product [Peniophora sp. CBMAI 1063]
MSAALPFKLPVHRVAIVTGAARGIGRSIALRLARDGHNVAVADLSGSGVYSVAREVEAMGRRSMAVYADVAKEEDVESMVNDVASELGSVDIMVANAGIYSLTSVLDTQLANFQRTMAVNAGGVFLCYKHAVRRMVEQGRGGRIIGASSLAGKSGDNAWFAYTASKFAVRGMTQAAALELARHNITVNAYAPGPTDTDMLRVLRADENLRERFLSSIPAGRIGQPDEIAHLVSWLTSEGSGFVTGQTININGGMHCD